MAEAMKQVDRWDFVWGVDKIRAYANSPQTINYSVTISAPHMNAYALVKYENQDYFLGVFER